MVMTEKQNIEQMGDKKQEQPDGAAHHARESNPAEQSSATNRTVQIV